MTISRFFRLLAILPAISLTHAYAEEIEKTEIRLTGSYKGTDADEASTLRRTITTTYGKLPLQFPPKDGYTYDVVAAIAKGTKIDSLKREDPKRDEIFELLDEAHSQFHGLISALIACGVQGTKKDDDRDSPITKCYGKDILKSLKALKAFDEKTAALKDEKPKDELKLGKLFTSVTETSASGNELLSKLGINQVSCPTEDECELTVNIAGKSKAGPGKNVSPGDEPTSAGDVTGIKKADTSPAPGFNPKKGENLNAMPVR